MAFTDDQIREKIVLLKEKGAPADKIRQFVELAKKEQTAPSRPLDIANEKKGDGFLQSSLKAVGNFALGFGKEAVDLPRKAAALGSSIGKSAAESGAGQAFGRGLSGLIGEGATEGLREVGRGLEGGVVRPEITKPVGTAQKVGAGVEQVAEFFLPGSASAKLGLKASKFGKAASLGARSAAEAGIFGGITALQEGEVNKSVGTAAAVGAAFPVAGEAVKLIKPFLKKKVPAKLINSLIKPPSKEFKFGKNPGLAVAQEGLVANSIEGLSKGITGKTKALNQELKNVVKKAKGFTDMSDDLGSVITKHVKNQTDDAVVNQMNNVLDQLANVKSPSIKGGKITLENIGVRNISKMNPEELHSFQKLIGKLTKWTGAPAEREVNKMLADLYSKVGKKLDKVSGAKTLQRRIANLIGAGKSIDQRTAVLQKADQLGLKNILGGGFLGGLTGDTGSERIVNAFIGSVLGKAAGSTAVKSRIASGLAKSRNLGVVGERVFGAARQTKKASPRGAIGLQSGARKTLPSG